MSEYNYCKLLLDKEKNNAHELYLRQPRDGQWFEYTWKETIENARRIRSFLYERGLNKGDKVAIISKNCAQWFMCDFAIALAGMVSVPIFPNQSNENIAYILEHAEVKLVFTGKLDEPERIFKAISPNYIRVNFDYHLLNTDYQWADVLAVTPDEDFELPEAKDLFTIVYSSGTTGKPKGAVYDFSAINQFLPCFYKDVKREIKVDKLYFISYLPLAHIYERTQLEIGSVIYPSVISFVESSDTFTKDMQTVKPNIFMAVPRIYGVMKEKIEEKLPPALLNILLKIPGVNHFIKNKIRQTLGFENVITFGCGAAHLPNNIFDFFESLGIIIQEGYGQTENMAYVTVNKLETLKEGYAGTAREGVRLKLGAQQEILVCSDFLMKGYYKAPELTEEAFTPEGCLKTGDTGEIDEQGRLKILSRLSEIFKNQKGEFIHPTKIEMKFHLAAYVDNLSLFGQGLPRNVLLVSLNEKGRHTEKAHLEQVLEQAIEQTNASLRSYEKVAHILVTEDVWTIEKLMITPTLKVKRAAVYEAYQQAIENIPKSAGKIIWI